MRKQRQTPPPPLPEQPPVSALTAQLQAKGFTSTTSPATPPVVARDATKAAGAIDLAKSGKIVVRRERKGHGGKTVTLVQWMEHPPANLAPIAQAMRKALGCGSTVEDNTVILQGDIAPRAQSWLQAHGATRIVLG